MWIEGSRGCRNSFFSRELKSATRGGSVSSCGHWNSGLDRNGERVDCGFGRHDRCQSQRPLFGSPCHREDWGRSRGIGAGRRSGQSGKKPGRLRRGRAWHRRRPDSFSGPIWYPEKHRQTRDGAGSRCESFGTGRRRRCAHRIAWQFR